MSKGCDNRNNHPKITTSGSFFIFNIIGDFWSPPQSIELPSTEY